jgi:hypothetical protein
MDGRQAGEEGIEGAACYCQPACTTGQILSIFCYSVRAMIKHTQQPIFVRVVIKSITQMRPVGRVCIGIFFVLSVSCIPLTTLLLCSAVFANGHSRINNVHRARRAGSDDRPAP